MVRKFTGFHGTEKEIANRIIRSNFVLSNKGWLGKGVYFFEESLDRAIDWARFSHPGKIANVIEVVLEIPNEFVFDTTTDSHAIEFHDFRDSIIKRIEQGKNRDLLSHNSGDFDGKIYDLIAQKKKSILIRAKTFTQPKIERSIHIPTSRVPNAVELCLKNVSYVKSKSKASLPCEEG